jgi:hypothetical protein
LYPSCRSLFFGWDEVEGLADGLGGLPPLEESLGGEAGGFDGCAGSGGVDAGLFDGVFKIPRDLIVLFGACVDEGLHGAARKIAVFGEVGDDDEGVGVGLRSGVRVDEVFGLFDGGSPVSGVDERPCDIGSDAEDVGVISIGCAPR